MRQRQPSYSGWARPGREHLPLTPRELEALRWFSHGLTREMVAEVMGISTETVKTTVAVARMKLRAKNTAHAVGNALRLGLLR